MNEKDTTSEAAELPVSTPFQLVLARWIEQRWGIPAETVVEPRLEIEVGGTCGEGTCWYEDEARVSWRYADEDEDPRNETLYIALGKVVEELAAIDADASVASKSSRPGEGNNE